MKTIGELEKKYQLDYGSSSPLGTTWIDDFLNFDSVTTINYKKAFRNYLLHEPEFLPLVSSIVKSGVVKLSKNTVQYIAAFYAAIENKKSIEDVKQKMKDEDWLSLGLCYRYPERDNYMDVLGEEYGAHGSVVFMSKCLLFLEKIENINIKKQAVKDVYKDIMRFERTYGMQETLRKHWTKKLKFQEEEIVDVLKVFQGGDIVGANNVETFELSINVSLVQKYMSENLGRKTSVSDIGRIKDYVKFVIHAYLKGNNLELDDFRNGLFFEKRKQLFKSDNLIFLMKKEVDQNKLVKFMEIMLSGDAIKKCLVENELSVVDKFYQNFELSYNIQGSVKGQSVKHKI